MSVSELARHFSAVNGCWVLEAVGPVMQFSNPVSAGSQRIQARPSHGAVGSLIIA